VSGLPGDSEIPRDVTRSQRGTVIKENVDLTFSIPHELIVTFSA
jgi:hypothetical protein